MGTFFKGAAGSVTGTSAIDLILVTSGADAETGTISGGAGADTLRFASLVDGDLLFIGDNITGIEVVELGGGKSAAPTVTRNALDVDASAALNGLTIRGNAGANFITGSAFDDTLVASLGEDQLFGGDGNDTFVIGSVAAGNPLSVIDGEEGFDTLLVTMTSGTLALGAATNVERVLINNAGSASVDASGVFSDTGLEIVGGAGANRLVGTDLDDTITGGAGRDTLEGGAGNDVFVIDRAIDYLATEVISGGDGIDELRFNGSHDFELLILGAAVDVERVVMTGSAGLEVDATGMSSAVHIVGNDGANDFRGTAKADTLEGGAGNDLFIINSAADHAAGELVSGGDGFDTLQLQSALPQTLVVQAGVDVERIQLKSLLVASNIDASALTSGTQIRGSDMNNVLTGGAGNDTLVGLGGADTLAGGDGDDTFLVTSPVQLINDVIDGGAGNDGLLLTQTADLNFVNFMLPAALPGIETVELGNSMVPSVFGGSSISVLADNRDDGTKIVGTSDVHYWVSGSAYDDTLVGGVLADTLLGAAGNDSLSGGGGADSLVAGTGADILDGGDGGDIYTLRDLDWDDDVVADSGSDGVDTVNLVVGDFFFLSSLSGPIQPGLQLEGIERVAVEVTVTPQNVEFDFSDRDQGFIFNGILDELPLGGPASGLLTLVGTDFGDRFEAGFGHHRYVGGLGDDTFAGANRDSRYEGGDGHDEVWLNSASYALPSSWSGIEQIVLGDVSTGATTGIQGIRLSAGGSANALEITGNDGNNTVIGTRFDDTIAGNGGHDTISGGLGNDVIDGGASSDYLLGGGGDDVFVDFTAGDCILGGNGNDTLQITGAGVSLNLLTVSNAAIRGVETIDITGTGANELTLAYADVKGNLGYGPTHALHVLADADDTVNLSGTWTENGTLGDITTWIATSHGQTVYVEIEQPAASGQAFFAVAGPDSIVGGTGNDTVTFADGTFDPSSDLADGGAGIDTLLVDGTLLNMNEGVFGGFELVQLTDGANFFANDDALDVAAVAGSNQAHLGANAAQGYTGDDQADFVWLGAAGQEVHTGDGADEVRAATTELAGSTLDLGSDAGQLILEGSGAANLLDAASLSPALDVSYATAITSLVLDNGGHRVFVNANADASFTSGDNSGGDDTFRFNNNVWSDRAYTINGFLQGSDTIDIGIVSQAGDYYDETNTAGVDAALPDDGLRNAVLDTEAGRLVVDYNADGAYGAGDLTINLPGVTDLTAGTDILMV